MFVTGRLQCITSLDKALAPNNKPKTTNYKPLPETLMAKLYDPEWHPNKLTAVHEFRYEIP